jgi:hypothetical protein
LVAHGITKRKLTEGRYWIEILHDKIIKDDFNGVKIITDIRYDDYEGDEVGWLKDELNGVLVHISQFSYRSDANEGALVKEVKAAANSEEERNDPKVKEKSDFQIEWELLESGHIDELSPYVDNFMKWLQEKNQKGNR